MRPPIMGVGAAIFWVVVLRDMGPLGLVALAGLLGGTAGAALGERLLAARAGTTVRTMGAALLALLGGVLSIFAAFVGALFLVGFGP